MHPGNTTESRVYIGNLPDDVRTRDLEDIFYKFGRIRDIDVHTRGRGPPFAFVEFEDPLDARDAIRGRNGYDLDGYRLRVEVPKGLRSGAGQSRGNWSEPHMSYGGSRGGGHYAPRQPRRTEWRIIVTGLPPSGSWQDLKDHFREAGDICFADVLKDKEGTGVLEYASSKAMEYAINKLDKTKFRSHEGETSTVRVRADETVKKPKRSRSRERSRSRSYSRSRSRSHSKRRSYSRSRSRSRS